MSYILYGYEREREELEEILLRGFQQGSPSWRVLAQRSGIKLISDPDGDNTHGCHWYVFQNESWYHDPAQRAQFLGAPVDFLLQHGYVEVQQPIKEDVVSYFSYDDQIHTTHSARFTSDETVCSKFGRYGPTAEHALELVPYPYGDYVRFFRKVEEPEKPQQ
jgi:hypothetical protein